jgi:hypothetical protein
LASAFPSKALKCFHLHVGRPQLLSLLKFQDNPIAALSAATENSHSVVVFVLDFPQLGTLMLKIFGPAMKAEPLCIAATVRVRLHLSGRCCFFTTSNSWASTSRTSLVRLLQVLSSRLVLLLGQYFQTKTPHGLHFLVFTC